MTCSDYQTAEAVTITRTSLPFFKDLQLWYHRAPASDQDPGQHENVVVLSEEFWREIQEHRTLKSDTCFSHCAPHADVAGMLNVLAGIPEFTATLVMLRSNKSELLMNFWMCASKEMQLLI